MDGFSRLGVQDIGWLRGDSSVNQLETNIYPQTDVHKSSIAVFAGLGFYGPARNHTITGGPANAPAINRQAIAQPAAIEYRRGKKLETE